MKTAESPGALAALPEREAQRTVQSGIHRT
jgi:hypothetical protein